MINESTNTVPSAEEAFRTHLFAQLDEIMKFKWCLGEKIRRDPLETMTMDDVCLDWIEKHAAAFRAHWESKKR